MRETLTGHVQTDENPADLLTKVVLGCFKRKHLIRMYLYDRVDHECTYSSDVLFDCLEVPLIYANYSTKGQFLTIIVLLSQRLPFKHSA